ncbi:MAG: hypothetical protein ACYCQJ_16150 [Nitrososphaerales archaeon]
MQGRPNKFLHPRGTSVQFEEDELRLFKSTAAKHGDNISDLLRQWAREYIKAHEQNDQLSLDLSIQNPSVKAFPTVWDSSAVSEEKLSEYELKELQEMEARAENALRNLKNAIDSKTPLEKVSQKTRSEADIQWLMSSRKWTREQAEAYLS